MYEKVRCNDCNEEFINVPDGRCFKEDEILCPDCVDDYILEAL